jgi:ubiquinone/menaquinone biosynthesis C-methylase UbiE
MPWRGVSCEAKMTDYAAIYADQADQYEALVAREDYHHALLPAIKTICSLTGIDIVELGAGTGRITRLLAPEVRSVLAFDRSPAMLARARRELQHLSVENWQLGVADHRHIPLPDACADLVIAGWTICYAALWSEQDWRSDLDCVFAEIERILRPNGTIIIIETQGTGYTYPNPPSELQDYFAYLSEHAFQQTWIRTDYQFQNLAEAIRLTRFFFGETLADQLQEQQSCLLPECTGIWSKQRSALLSATPS